MDTNLLVSYTGAYQDPVSCGYPLGNGYRMYLPELMRFAQSDSMSPFGKGGIHPYAYCEADPINHSDPSGHFGGLGILGVVATLVDVVVAEEAAANVAATVRGLVDTVATDGGLAAARAVNAANEAVASGSRAARGTKRVAGQVIRDEAAQGVKRVRFADDTNFEPGRPSASRNKGGLLRSSSERELAVEEHMITAEADLDRAETHLSQLESTPTRPDYIDQRTWEQQLSQRSKLPQKVRDSLTHFDSASLEISDSLNEEYFGRHQRNIVRRDELMNRLDRIVSPKLEFESSSDSELELNFNPDFR